MSTAKDDGMTMSLLISKSVRHRATVAHSLPVSFDFCIMLVASSIYISFFSKNAVYFLSTFAVSVNGSKSQPLTSSLCASGFYRND